MTSSYLNPYGDDTDPDAPDTSDFAKLGYAMSGMAMAIALLTFSM